MRWSIEIQSAPSSNAVSAVEAKTHLRVSHSSDDTYIGNLIKAAEAMVETYTNRRLVAGTYDLKLDEWGKGIKLPYSPVSSITHIKYYDTDNSQQTWADTNYFYSVKEEPTYIEYINDPPSLYDYRVDLIEVRFVVGYSTVPEALRQAILLLVGDMYENRLDYPRERFTAWKMLCYPYRVFYD